MIPESINLATEMGNLSASIAFGTVEDYQALSLVIQRQAMFKSTIEALYMWVNNAGISVTPNLKRNQQKLAMTMLSKQQEQRTGDQPSVFASNLQMNRSNPSSSTTTSANKTLVNPSFTSKPVVNTPSNRGFPMIATPVDSKNVNAPQIQIAVQKNQPGNITIPPNPTNPKGLIDLNSLTLISNSVYPVHLNHPSLGISKDNDNNGENATGDHIETDNKSEVVISTNSNNTNLSNAQVSKKKRIPKIRDYPVLKKPKPN